MHRRAHLLPFAAAGLGVALFAGMDAAMKGLALTLGAYSAMLWRQAFAVFFAAPPYLLSREHWPSRAAFRFHLLRGGVTAVMAVAWFYGLARLPMAEAIALSFVAPLIALYLAAVLLGERIARDSILASLLGLAGMLVLLAARLGDDGGERHIDGVLAILGSAVLYAWNLILMRQQALVASPTEVSFFQSLICGAWLLAFLPVAVLLWPGLPHVPGGDQWLLTALSAALTVSSLYLLSWAYGRSEAQALVPVEYSAFLWAVLLGAAVYGETLRPTTLVGAVLIVAACLLAARRPRHVSPIVEGAI